jgi:hypothetical protein
MLRSAAPVSSERRDRRCALSQRLPGIVNAASAPDGDIAGERERNWRFYRRTSLYGFDLFGRFAVHRLRAHHQNAAVLSDRQAVV